MPSFTMIGAASAGATSSGGAATCAAVDTTGANLLIVVTTNLASNPTAVFTETAGNTWTATTRRSNGGGAIQVFYVFNPTTNSADVVAITALASNFAAVTFMAFANAQSSPFDQEAGSTSQTTGSITPSQNNELIITGYTDSGALGIGTNGDQSLAGAWPVIGGTRFSHAVGFFQQGTAAAVTRAFTQSGATAQMASTVASFKMGTVPSGGGTGGAWGHA